MIFNIDDFLKSNKNLESDNTDINLCKIEYNEKDSILLDKEIKRLKSETHGTDLSDKILKLKAHFREYCSYKTMIYQKNIDPSDFYIQKIYEDVNKVIST